MKISQPTDRCGGGQTDWNNMQNALRELTQLRANPLFSLGKPPGNETQSHIIFPRSLIIFPPEELT